MLISVRMRDWKGGFFQTEGAFALDATFFYVVILLTCL